MIGSGMPGGQSNTPLPKLTKLITISPAIYQNNAAVLVKFLEHCERKRVS